MISVIVPAHNEEKVIRRCLEAMTAGTEAGELEIIVVCNGCTDGTATVAREFGDPVKVIATPFPSKSKALNLGDGAAHGYPRFYVDADVILCIDSIRQVAAVFKDGKCLVAAPGMRVNLEDRGWAVRAYYDIWTRLPYVSQGIIGSGVYVTSERGRARFDRFPDLLADDNYVRLLFAPEERLTVKNCHFLVTPPKSLWTILKIRTRYRKSCLQLRRAYPELARNERRDYPGALRNIISQPRLWPKFALYGCVVFSTRIGARWKYHVRGLSEWERDESSRTVTSS